jgi:two-component system response regulator FixJ
MSHSNKVFVVDDNDDFRNSVAWMLRGEGYQTIEFDSVNVAINALKTAAKPDLENSCLLLDVRMPEMSGLEFHDELKKQAVTIPVVYMTGHADVPLAVEAMKKGATTFLEKPLDKQQLTNAIENAIESRATVNTDYLSRQKHNSTDCHEFIGKLHASVMCLMGS